MTAAFKDLLALGPRRHHEDPPPGRGPLHLVGLPDAGFPQGRWPADRPHLRERRRSPVLHGSAGRPGRKRKGAQPSDHAPLIAVFSEEDASTFRRIVRFSVVIWTSTNEPSMSDSVPKTPAANDGAPDSRPRSGGTSGRKARIGLHGNGLPRHRPVHRAHSRDQDLPGRPAAGTGARPVPAALLSRGPDLGRPFAPKHRGPLRRWRESTAFPIWCSSTSKAPRLDVAIAKAGRLDSAETIRVVEQTAAALDFAHSKGVVHRDIRPANIILATDRRVRIADFGIARIEGSQLTQHGEVLGTPAYMSPEQIRGQELVPRERLVLARGLRLRDAHRAASLRGQVPARAARGPRLFAARRAEGTAPARHSEPRLHVRVRTGPRQGPLAPFRRRRVFRARAQVVSGRRGSRRRAGAGVADRDSRSAARAPVARFFPRWRLLRPPLTRGGHLGHRRAQRSSRVEVGSVGGRDLDFVVLRAPRERRILPNFRPKRRF